MAIPFDREKELADAGFYPAVPGAYNIPSFPTRRFSTPITPKENTFRVFRGEKPEWLPNMSTDFNFIQPAVMPDAYARNNGGTDWFGIEWQYDPANRAAMVTPGTRRLSEVENWKEELVFPDLLAIDWQKDYDDNYKSLLAPERATCFVIVNGYLERLADLSGYENALCAYLEEPEIVEELYDRFDEFHIALMKIAREVYHADIITFHDDLGTQRSSFLSPELCRAVLYPHYKKVAAAAHELGMFINFHSCGAVSNMIEMMIDAGFDCWEGQDACNDKLALMEKYGDRLAQLSICIPDPSTSDEDLKALLFRMVHGVGARGRYITWFVDMNFARSFDSAEYLYAESRRLFGGEK